MSELFEYTHDKWQWIYDDIPGDTVFDDDMNPIAIVCPYDERNKIGRLIAAAPEMYKILDGLICKLKANGADEWEEIDEAIQEIERLIERIDGEEHEELHEVEAQA